MVRSLLLACARDHRDCAAICHCRFARQHSSARWRCAPLLLAHGFQTSLERRQAELEPFAALGIGHIGSDGGEKRKPCGRKSPEEHMRFVERALHLVGVHPGLLSPDPQADT